MKNNIKFIAVLTLFTILVSSVAGAAAFDSFSINDEKTELTISGTPDGTKKGDAIIIQVLNQGVTLEEVADSYTSGASSTFWEDFVYATQVPANENGGYNEVISMEGRLPGAYQIIINGQNAAEIYYASKKIREAIITEIKENCTIGNIFEETMVTEDSAIKYLKENFDLYNERSTWINAFDISDSIIFEVNENGLFKVFLEMVPTLTINNIKSEITLAAYIAALNESKIDIIAYSDSLSLDADYVTAYNEYVSDKTSFVEIYFKDKGYKTLEVVNAAFEKAVLLEACNSFSAWSDVEEYIGSFGEAAGVNMTKFNSAAFNTAKKNKLYIYVLELLKSGSFERVDAFAEKVNSKINALLGENASTSGSGGSSGGGGGGSGSGGSGVITSTGSATSLTSPIVPTEKAPEAPTKDAFNDIDDYDWAKKAIEALSEKGIVSGTGNGKFEPSREVKREEILAMLLRAFEVEASNEKSDFTDAEADAWYNGLLAVAKEKGFVSGRPDGSFGVGDSVTREDACVMAYTIAKAMGKEFNASKTEIFTDDSEASEYSVDAIYALKKAGVINGKGEGKFAPKSTCTRAEAAKIIYALIAE